MKPALKPLRRSVAGAGIVIAMAAGSAGCASALRPLDPQSELGRNDAGAVDPAAAARHAADAEAAFARRPDLPSVRQAEELWLRAAVAAPESAAGIIGAVRAQVWLAQRLDDRQDRRDKAATAVDTARWCGHREPDNPDCHYWLALAVGVQADQRRATANDGLRVMIEQLRLAIMGNETLDYAGPRRVLARVYLRAPGWPTGPGDADSGLLESQRAVELFPEYPPNLLTLAEAHAEVDEIAESRRRYRQAAEAAAEWIDRGHPEADEWLREALDALDES